MWRRRAGLWRVANERAAGAGPSRPADLAVPAATIKSWGRELGFQAIGIADTDLSAVEPRLAAWLPSGFAGELDYMRKHGAKRKRPASLVPGTLRIIFARLDH